MTERTPGKWVAVPDEENEDTHVSRRILILPEGGAPNAIATVTLDWKRHGVNWVDRDRAESEANAEYIVRAANAHDALVEAAQGLLDAINTDGATHFGEPEDSLRAALKLAGPC